MGRILLTVIKACFIATILALGNMVMIGYSLIEKVRGVLAEYDN